jgi:hypothetical protein
LKDCKQPPKGWRKMKPPHHNCACPECVAWRGKLPHPIHDSVKPSATTMPNAETIEDYKAQIATIDSIILDLLEAKGRAEAAIEAMGGM